MFVRNGRVAGSVYKAGLVAAGAGQDAAQPEPQVLHRLQGQEDDLPTSVQRLDGVHGVGGGWHEVVIGGEVIDKIRGADAAQEAYEAYQEVNDGDD